MTRTDSVVVGTLVALLAILAALIGVPSMQIASTPIAPTARPVPSVPEIASRPYVEGVLGSPTSVSPLTARTQADRDLVALVFAGLVRNGPDGTVVPDLAERWTVDAKGKTWTVDLRADALWQDGEPVTSDDVVFTIRTLQDPQYSGPSASSWNDVEVDRAGPHRVTFTLSTPLGGFLQALTQPIAPAHLLADVPVADLPVDPFGQSPIGPGPFSLLELTDTSATLVPVGTIAGARLGCICVAERRRDRLADDPSTDPPAIAAAALPRRHRVPLFRRCGRAGGVVPERRARCCVGSARRRLAADLGTSGGARLLRYPGSTLSAVLLNLRPGHPEFATRRSARRTCRHRSGQADQVDAFSGLASRPPTRSRRRRPCSTRTPTRPCRTPARRRQGAARGAAGPVRRRLAPQLRRRPHSSSHQPDRGRATRSCTLPADRVVKDWKATWAARPSWRCRPANSSGERLRPGTFQSPSPTLRSASTPTCTRCWPSSARPRPAAQHHRPPGPDTRPVPRDGASARRDGGPSGRVQRAPEAARRGPLPVAAGLPRRARRRPRHGRGPAARQVNDAGRIDFGTCFMAPRCRPVTVDSRRRRRGGGIGRRAGFRT